MGFLKNKPSFDLYIYVDTYQNISQLYRTSHCLASYFCISCTQIQSFVKRSHAIKLTAHICIINEIFIAVYKCDSGETSNLFIKREKNKEKEIKIGQQSLSKLLLELWEASSMIYDSLLNNHFSFP